MNQEDKQNPELDEVEIDASQWVLRLDRGLTANEQDQYLDWLAQDPAHGDAISRLQGDWQRLNKLAAWCPEFSSTPNPDLLAPKRVWYENPWVKRGLVAAAVLLLALWVSTLPFQQEESLGMQAEVASASQVNHQVLEDGSSIKTQPTSQVDVAYNNEQRAVYLSSGEAYFQVAKDQARPFTVYVEDYQVRAIGTAFSIKLESSTVEVLVEEGVVELARNNRTDANHSQANIPQLIAKQRAIISRDPNDDELEIATLTKDEIKRVYAWQHRMLIFDDQPLQNIIQEFNRLNEVQLSFAEDAVGELNISGSMRSDNINGFLRLLNIGFEIEAERLEDGTIILSHHPK